MCYYLEHITRLQEEQQIKTNVRLFRKTGFEAVKTLNNALKTFHMFTLTRAIFQHH